MIEFRHHTDRTVKIPVEELGPEWTEIAYSSYAIRAVTDGYGNIGVIEIKDWDDIPYEDDDE